MSLDNPRICDRCGCAKEYCICEIDKDEDMMPTCHKCGELMPEGVCEYCESKFEN